MKILDGKKLSENILLDLDNKIKLLNLSLAVIQIGDSLASNVYIKQKEKVCQKLNIKFNHIKLSNDVSEDKVLSIIDNLNKLKTTGILIQLPIPKHLNIIKLQNSINYQKDVDGLNYFNVNQLINNKEGIIPCTAKGIITLLKSYNIKMESKNVVIVGRSSLVSKPLFNLMLNENATVTICHSKTKELKSITKNADILIVATGVKHLIKSDMVKEGSVIIDVGINKIDNKLYGDVDFEHVKKKVSYITPVPGGIGPMTICSLIENLYEAYLLQNKIKDLDV